MNIAVRKATVASMRTQLDLWSRELARSKAVEVSNVGGLLRVSAGHLGHALEAWPNEFGQVLDADSKAFNLSAKAAEPAIQ
jgi:hypothetical protein